MRNAGASRDYDFREKNRWRVRLWDEVLRRVGKRRTSELFLYLAGPEDLDREVAIRKGVPSENLIAIDRNHSTVRSIRAAGNAAICGDVIDVLTTWPKASQVCAIVLDFCQGFQKLDDLKHMANLAVVHPALKRAVLAINLQRGRDAESNEQRAFISTFMEKHMPEFDPKHRGMIFGLWYVLLHISKCQLLSEYMSTGSSVTYSHPALSQDLVLTPDKMHLVWQSLLQQFNLKTWTYRSGGLCLDSVVMTSAGEVFDVDPLCEDTVQGEVTKRRVRAIALSTAATLAVRTRRLRQR